MRTERDDKVIRIRPTITCEKALSEEENFQNTTIRPILKLQNAILLAQFHSYLEKFKPVFNAYNQKAQMDYIEEVMKKDPRIKNSLIASVVSLFTIDEYEYYRKNKNALNKRMVQMIIRRLEGQLESLL
ncbi:MAG: glyoxalase [Bacteroidota bacterium]